MKSFTFLSRVILGLVLFVTGGGISLAADTYVTNTAVNGTTYTFKVTSTKDKTANVSLSQIGGTALASYNGTDIDLIAAYPNGTFTVDGTTYTITSMDAMNRNTTIKTVEMPSTVTSLPNSCFDGCSALTTVSFPGLTTLPNNCFYGCTALTSFSFTDIKTIGSLAFYNCSKLTDITIPSGATVGQRAFQNCTGLTKLTIPKGTYNNRIFDGCTNVPDLFIHTGAYINDKWEGHGCFGSMPSVTNVTLIDDGDHTIPAYLFGCASFKDGVTLNIPESITAIGDYAFYSANFPKTLDLSKFKSFGTYAFANNKTITGNNGVVTFADNAKFTGEQTFLNCTALSGTLTIPNGANIPYKAFDGCSGIESIVLHSGMTSGEHDRDGCFMSMSSVKSVSIKYDDGKPTIPANVFGGASFKDGVTLEIDKSITGIGDYAFNNANFPTTLDLSKFTSYGASAFEYNSVFKGNDNGVIAVSKPSDESSVTVGSKAFWNTQATEVDVDPNVTYSGCSGDGPYNGSKIKAIKFNSDITDIPAYVFNNAAAIPADCSVTWPTNTIRNIGEKAFYGVTFAAAIPKAMTGTIGASAYAGNSISDEITIPDGCTGIGASAFYNCDKITSVTVPATTTSIGTSAFADCDLLAALNFATLTDGKEPNLVLDGRIINNDPNMRGITITNAVKTIYYSSDNSSNNTFSGLTSPFTVTLKSDKVTATKSSVAGGTFFSFKNSDTTKPNTLNVIVDDGVTTIPANMFSENNSESRTSSNINVLNISGNSLTEIKSGAFQDNQELTSVDLSGAPNLKTIDEKAFYHCSMTSINFGTNCNIDTIGKSAFESCDRLDSITIGKVKTLGDYAFNNCSSLAKINQASDGKNDLRSSTLTRIGQYTFGGCTTLANLYLPSTLMRINAEAFTNGEGKAAKAASDDKVFIKADVPFGITTFSRGFGVKYNTDDKDKLIIDGKTYKVYVPTRINRAAGQLVLQEYTGKQVLSDEVDASVQEAGTEHRYSNQPVGFLLIQNGWQQITPTDLTGKAETAGPGSVNMRVLFSGTTVQKGWGNSAFSGQSMMRGVIDPVNIKDVTDKYGISKRDLALHAMTTKGTFPAGRAYIYAPDNSGSGSAKYSGFTLFYSDEPLTNTTTGINKGVTEVNKDRMADDSYYDLSGRKVNSPTEGIYIHHGRKVVIKRM